MTPLVIVGAGGHGRELYDTVVAINERSPVWDVVGFVDDDPAHLDRLERLGQRVLGDVGWLIDHPHPFGLGIGTGPVRRTLASRLEAAGCEATTLIHPGARVGVDCRLGEGVVLYDRSTLTTNVELGVHTHVNVGCAVQHDSTVGDFVQLSPGVFINGDCAVGDSVFFGTGAVLTRGCSVGQGARVGAGAVVLGDVEPGVTVVGSPARPARSTGR